MKRVINFALMLILLSGCAGPEVLEFQKLSVPLKTEILLLKKISLRNDQISIAEGEYNAELENADGVFYRGPENCFTFLGTTYPGGIFITTHSVPKKFRLYYYKTKRDTPLMNSNALGDKMANYLEAVNDGKLMLLQPISGTNYEALISKK